MVLVQPKTGPYDILTWGKLPLGLLCVAAIPYQKGYDVIIIDQRFDNSWRGNLTKILKEEPICVGITTMTGSQIKYALEAARVVKEQSNVPVVFGGIHPSLLPAQTLENPYVDVVIVGEGEYAFIELLQALRERRNLATVKGIWYKKGGAIYSTPRRELIRNLDELPELPLVLVDVEQYVSRAILNGRRSIDLQTSRGCPAKCAFCFNQVFNRGYWRGMSSKEAVRRVSETVRKYAIDDVFFTDDNCAASIPRLKEICQMFVSENLNITWRLDGIRADSILRMEDETLQLLYASGCNDMYIGAESGSQEILDRIDKNLRVETIIEANRKLAKYPFIVKWTFICGFPTESEEQREMSVKLAVQLCKENLNAYTPFLVFTPYPGTKLYDEAIEHGFNPPERLEDWANFSFDNFPLSSCAWYPRSEARKLNSLSFTSAFLNQNATRKIDSKLARFLFRLYAPIACWRFKGNHHAFPIESLVGRKLLNLL